MILLRAGSKSIVTDGTTQSNFIFLSKTIVNVKHTVVWFCVFFI